MPKSTVTPFDDPQTRLNATNIIGGDKPARSSSTRHNVAAMLGKAAQAVMGPYQDNVVAQLGGLGAQLAQRKVYSDTVSALLAGEDISSLDTRILDPEQITAAMEIKDRATKSKLAEGELTLKNLERLDKLNLSEQERAIAMRKILSDEQQTDKTLQAQKDIAGARITSEENIASGRNETTLKATRMQTEADKERTLLTTKNALDQIRASKEPKVLDYQDILTQALSGDLPNIPLAISILKKLGQHDLAKALGGSNAGSPGRAPATGDEFGRLLENSGVASKKGSRPSGVTPPAGLTVPDSFNIDTLVNDAIGIGFDYTGKQIDRGKAFIEDKALDLQESISRRRSR